jgi:hypothetical protein
MQPKCTQGVSTRISLLLKGMQAERNKWNIPYSWTGQLNNIKVSVTLSYFMEI